MGPFDKIVGGGLASLPISGEFAFAQRSEPVARYARGGMAGEDMMYEDGPLDFGFAPEPAPVVAPPPAPAPVFAPTPAPVPVPAPAPVQPQGYWTSGGMQGEDYIEPQFIAAAPPPPAVDPTNYFTSTFNYAKHGWTGGDPGVYNITEGGGESGNVTTTDLVGVTPEFANWAKSQGIQVVDQSRGPNADIYLVKDGKVIDHYYKEPSWIDKAAPALVGIGLAALNPALATSFGGGLAGAAGAGALTGGLTSGVFGGDILKGALTGGIGGAAMSYLNPAAASAGQSVAKATESKLLGDIATGALRGAGSSGIGAALRGDSIGDALLTGAIGGGITGGVGSAGASAGLSPYLTSPAGAGLAAMALGRDPEAAAINALIGQMMAGGAKQAPDEKQGLGGGSAAGAVLAVDPAELPAGVADALAEFMRQGQAGGNLEQDFVVTPNGIRDTAGNYGDFDPVTGVWQPYAPLIETAPSSGDAQRFEVIGAKEQPQIDAILKPFDLGYDQTLTDFDKYVSGLTQEAQEGIDLGAGLDTLVGKGGEDKSKGGGGGGGGPTAPVAPTRPRSGIDPFLLSMLASRMGSDDGGESPYQNTGARIASRSPFGLMYGLGE